MISAAARQLALLRFIAGYLRHSGGISPSYAECRDALGLRSSSGIHFMICGLEQRGLIRRIPNHARAIELLAPVAIPAAPDGAPLYFVPVGEAR